MALQIISKEMIKPSIPTPHQFRNFKFSFLDQIMPPSYIPLTLFYNTKFDLSNISEIHHRIKNSLSETLTIFYPLAGRIQNSVTVDCNDEGVSYTEAIARFTLSEFLIKPDITSLNKFLPLDANVPRDVKDVLLSIQVTVLGCGGFVIGVCMFHRISDMTTMASFLRSWADTFKGKGKKEVKVDQDFTLGSSIFLPPLSSFPDDYESNLMTYIFYKANHSITRRFVFDVSSITTLRAKATSKNVPNPTRYEALTGFICERLMVGLKLRSKKPPPTLMITNMVNLRRRFEPALPDTSFGNFLWLASTFYTPPGPNMEISYYVKTLREVLHEVNNTKLGELEPKIAIQEMCESQAEIIRSISDGVLKEFKFTSWCNQGLYNLDFGWGKPCWVAHMGDIADEGQAPHQFMFLEGKVGGEIELWALLGEDEMAMQEDDQQFTEFATPNPSIPLDFD